MTAPLLDDAALVAAARTALAHEWGPVEVLPRGRLSGSARTAVLRATVQRPNEDPIAVVLKASLDGGGGGARETAALRLLRREAVDAAVPLLADGGDPPVLVLADLGDGPTLVDRLLGSDAEAADEAVVSWARALGQVQAATASLRPDFAAELAACSPLGAPSLDTTADLASDAARDLARRLPRLGVQPAPDALNELTDLAAQLSRPGAPAGLVPGDTCPSNAVEARGRTVLIDFEGAEHRHLAWEAAYLLLPWPTCWCAWTLPEPVVQRALATWRDTVSGVAPQVMEPSFDADLRRATAVWAAASIGWLLPFALDGEPEHPDPVRRAATTPARPALHHRAAVAAELGDVAPVLAGVARQLLASMQSAWGRLQPPVSPAFS